MAVRFPTPARAPQNLHAVNEFLGVDFTNYPANVDMRRSPNAVNMIRDVPGKVRKAMGYEQVDAFEGQINAVFFRRGDKVPLVHAGTQLWRWGAEPPPEGEQQSGEEVDDKIVRKVLYEGMNDVRSSAWQFGENLFIVDGKRYLMYDGEKVVPVDEYDKAYIPTITIAKSPKGGGEQYESLNVLQKKFRERFLGDASSKAYSLSFENLTADKVTVFFLNGTNGKYDIEKKEGTDFTVERKTGVITFATAPPKSPLEGHDNVEIIASRTVPAGYANRINHCDVGTQYGVGGATDRLFLSGASDVPTTDGKSVNISNYDWHSGQNDPTYFGDLNYSVLGSPNSRVMGYSVLNDKLAAIKDEKDLERNVIIRNGTLMNNKAAFPISGTLQGMGAVAKYSFGYLGTEPLFLTRLGIFAITPQDLTGEKYSQNRSFYLNGKLLQEDKLQDAYAFVYKDFYILCLNGVAYILDGLQAVPPTKGMPYSTRQYCGFYRTNWPARVMWEQDGRLYFGAPSGKIYRLFEDPAAPISYSDDGKPIVARWETPDIDGQRFYKNKNFHRVSVKLGSAVSTGVNISALVRGRWVGLMSDTSSARYLDFGRLNFARFTFSTDTSARVSGGKMLLRRLDRTRFGFENGEIHEPFSLFSLAIEYRENGYKRKSG